MKPLDPWDLELRGTRLIEASAGTGKTHTLTTLYLRLLVEEGLLPSQILVVTYTHAATAELRDRIRRRIREAIAYREAPPKDLEERDADLEALLERGAVRRTLKDGRDPLRSALQDFDEAAIFTIHGFCQRTLRDHGFESGLPLDVELVEASDAIEEALARDLWARLIAEEEDDFVRWLLTGEGRKRWAFEPAELKTNLVGLLGADEEMPVLPSPASVPAPTCDEFASRRERLVAAWQRCTLLWRDEREELVEWLLHGKAINGKKYPKKSLTETWFPVLDEWVRRLDPDVEASSTGLPERPDWLKKLRPEALQAALNKGKTQLEDPFFDACAELEDAFGAWVDLLHLRALDLRRRFVDAVRVAARQRREERHLLFFDDLLSELRRALHSTRGDELAGLLRERFRFALIDEFQDTDPVQYDIFKRVWHRTRLDGSARGLILIGDPKQAIYSFRGADVFTYLAAHSDAAGDPLGLETNYRSDPGLIAALNALFSRLPKVFGIDDIEFHPVKARPDAARGLVAPGRSDAGLRVLLATRAALADDPDANAEKLATNPIRAGKAQVDVMRALAKDVADLLDSGATIEGEPVCPSDIAILCRRKVELARARRELEKLGIPCVDQGHDDVFDSEEATELLALLRAMLHPGQPAILRAALATTAVGEDAEDLARLDDDSVELASIAERYAEYGRIWSKTGFVHAFEAWRRGEGMTARLLGLHDGERRVTNWLHLADLLQRFVVDRAPSRAGLADWLGAAIADPDSRSRFGGDASLLRLETDEEAVSLLTLHHSKGLQYQIVYLPCLWGSWGGDAPDESAAGDAAKAHPPIRFHDPASDRRSLDLDGPDYARHAALAREETFAERLRLLYVGLTRARRQCVVYWGAIGKSFAESPLAWLLHGPSGFAEEGPGERFVAAAKSLPDEEWRREWEEVAARAGEDAVSIEDLDLVPRVRWQAPRKQSLPLVAPALQRPVPSPLVTTSFTGLVRHAEREPRGVSGPLVEGRDLDVDVASRTIVAEGASDLAGEMDGFPRGAEAGTLLHDVLEEVEPWDLEESGLVEIARRALERNAVDLRFVDQVVHVARSVARTPLRLEPESLRLADLAPGRLRPEMEFTLSTLAAGAMTGLTPRTLGECLATARTGSPIERYAERVTRLGWRELNGFLRGFIDAVFFDGQQYFLVDYKSNHLGGHQADYRPERLLAPMIEHDYVLQYLIYSVALDRHLRCVLDDYRYDRDFGGVYYLFLRGMAESHEPGCGVFFDRPEAAIVEGISRLLDGDPGVAT